MTIIKRRVRHLLKVKTKWLRSRIRPVLIDAKIRLGIPVRFQSPARHVLENTIIPFYASQGNMSRVLFVGCDWYTNHYRKFFSNSEYWTIDPEPKQGRYGAKNHIVDFVENLHNYFDEEYFDVIICNGVLGFGLDQRELAERAFDSCFTCLRPGGTFVLGRDDTPTFLSFPVDELRSLRKFKPYHFPPLAASNYSLKPRYDYLFSFFVKSGDICDGRTTVVAVDQALT